ncbi:hypothetical protein B0I35DRAFT_414242 [Stachybotrys elegans]|uniref:BTB domain-containing protein n=1 Tax=Stachybotrys elegans TaxID=80388 RepID=A0A8K0SFP8_9HYPO|nr:hypothetical protein B0I35DRAFT_414242 [Stachybotrys elegans]
MHSQAHYRVHYRRTSSRALSRPSTAALLRRLSRRRRKNSLRRNGQYSIRQCNFIVGSEATQYSLASRAIPLQSPYFRNLYDGGACEKKYVLADLTAFEEGIFLRFVEFLLDGTYTSPEPFDSGGRAVRSSVRPTRRRRGFGFSEELCVAMHRTYLDNVKWEGGVMPAYFQPPPRGPDVPPDCSSHPAISKGSQALKQRLLSKGLKYSTLLKYAARSKRTGGAEHESDTKPVSSYAGVFMTHIRVYELADHCGMVDLQLLALRKLDAAIHRSLYTLAWSMDSIMDTVRYCFRGMDPRLNESGPCPQSVLVYQLIIKLDAVSRYEAFWETRRMLRGFELMMNCGLERVFSLDERGFDEGAMVLRAQRFAKRNIISLRNRSMEL